LVANLPLEVAMAVEADTEVVAHLTYHTPVAARQAVAVLRAAVAMVMAAVVEAMGVTEVVVMAAMGVAVAPTHSPDGGGLRPLLGRRVADWLWKITFGICMGGHCSRVCLMMKEVWLWVCPLEVVRAKSRDNFPMKFYRGLTV
jgi:hypothetical protein